MKLHRKIKHNEKVCLANDLGSYAQGQGRNQARGQNRVSAITQKTTEAHLTKLHRKIEHNEKVWKAIAILCCLLSFTSYDNLLGLVVLILPNVVWI